MTHSELSEILNLTSEIGEIDILKIVEVLNLVNFELEKIFEDQLRCEYKRIQPNGMSKENQITHLIKYSTKISEETELPC